MKVGTLITVRATVLATPSGNLAIYDCGPNGTVFDVPLE